MQVYQTKCPGVYSIKVTPGPQHNIKIFAYKADLMPLPLIDDNVAP